MPLLLCIETATSVCSVSLVNNGKVLAIREADSGMQHAEKTAVFIEEVTHEAGIGLVDIDGVAISGGPGSYTGLRIGVSTAKGICWALDKPLIAVPTLEAMAWGVKGLFNDEPGDILFFPMIDARRMEVYTACFDASMNRMGDVEAVVVDTESFAGYPPTTKLCFFGDGMSKCKSLLSSHKNAVFVETFSQSSTHLYGPAAIALEKSVTEHLGMYEPNYFKEFVAGKGSVVPDNRQ